MSTNNVLDALKQKLLQEQAQGFSYRNRDARDSREPVRGARDARDARVSGGPSNSDSRDSRDSREPARDTRGPARDIRGSNPRFEQRERDSRDRGYQRGFQDRRGGYDRRDDRGYRDDSGYNGYDRRDDRGYDRRGGRDGRDGRGYDRGYDRREGGHDRRDNFRDSRDRRDDTRRVERNFRPEDVASAVPIDQLPRKSLWDVKPKGFEKVSAERAKISGLFPLPGEAKRIDISTVEGLVSSGDLNSHTSILFDETNIDASSSRSSKQLLVTGVEFTLYPVERLVDGIKNYIASLAVDGALIVRYELLLNKYLVLHLSTSSLATILYVSESILQNELNLGVKIARPLSYVTPVLAQESEPTADHDHKLAIVNVPTDITEDEIKKDLEIASPGCVLQMVRTHEGQSKGLVFVSVKGPVNEALDKISKIQIRDITIRCIVACPGLQQEQEVNYRSLPKIVQSNQIKESNVLVILNAVLPEDLKKPIIYDQVQKDVASECSKFGQVISLKIPKPEAEYKRNLKHLHTSVGKIFVKFDSVDTAKKAGGELHGRQYQERTVLVSFIPETDYELNLF